MVCNYNPSFHIPYFLDTSCMWGSVLDASRKTWIPYRWRLAASTRTLTDPNSLQSQVQQGSLGMGRVEVMGGRARLSPVLKGLTTQWGHWEANKISSSPWMDQRMFQHRCTERKMKIAPVLCYSHSYLTLQQSWIRWSFSWVCQGQGWLCGEGLPEYSLSNTQVCQADKGRKSSPGQGNNTNFRKTSYGVR